MKTVIIKNKIELIGTSAYLIDSNDLIIADLHLGIEKSILESGVNLENTNLKLLIANLKEYIDFIKEKYQIKIINKLIINGDLKHNFGKITEYEWQNITEFFKSVEDEFNKLVLIKGNHDNYANQLQAKFDLEVKDHLVVNDLLITHGDKIQNLDYSNIEVIIAGHIHPAITMSNEIRKEKYKLHLYGPASKIAITKNLISKTTDSIEINPDIRILVLASSHYLTIGTDLNAHNEDFCPYLEESVMDYNIFIVEKDVLNFGKLKENI